MLLREEDGECCIARRAATAATQRVFLCGSSSPVSVLPTLRPRATHARKAYHDAYNKEYYVSEGGLQERNAHGGMKKEDFEKLDSKKQEVEELHAHT